MKLSPLYVLTMRTLEDVTKEVCVYMSMKT